MNKNYTTPDFVNRLLPAREKDTNKGTYGKAMIIGGCYTMPGAAIIAANGALNGGAGLVTLAFPDVIYPAVTANLTECVFMPCKSADDGSFSKTEISRIIERAKKMDAVAIGPGLSVTNSTRMLVTSLLSSYTGKLIIDADALNILAEDTSYFRLSGAEIGITPHPGEMSRLTGKAIAEIQSARIQTAQTFSLENGVVVLLKGHETVIADSINDTLTINPTGTPAMARGGSGDLLTGLAVSFAAQGMPVYEALTAAAYIHGKAGEIAAGKYGEYSATIPRITDAIGEAIKSIG